MMNKIWEKMSDEVKTVEQVIGSLECYYKFLDNPENKEMIDVISMSLHHCYDTQSMNYDDSEELMKLTKTAIDILHKRLRVLCADIEHQSKCLAIQEGIVYVNHMEPKS